MKGIVKWYNPQKMVGFITGGDGKERFFKKSNIERPARERPKPILYCMDEVEFTLVEGGRIGDKIIESVRLVKKGS